MSQPSEIPRFTGEENPEEAEKWLGILISSTGSFTESGIFRLLRNKFPVGSISRTWFNGLQATATTSWNDFELEFYDQWIATKEQKEWEAFTHHILSEDMIFGKNTAVEIAHESIRLWVHDHLQLGKSIGREDRVLIDATNKLLPPFIKAYLQAFVKSKPQSFQTLCNEIKGVTQQILEYEEIRRSLSATEWSSVVERHVQQISEKVDKFIKANDDHRPTKSASSPRDQSNIDNSSSAESLNWEMSSPLTSVLSEGVAPTILGLSTPVVQSARLSHPEDEPNALYRIPQEWRKPMCLKRRDEIVIIAQRAIDFIESFRKPFTVKLCQKWNFMSAIAIRDTFIDSRRYVDTAPISGSDSDGVYDDLMLTISRVYRYYAYETHWFRTQPVNGWVEHAESKDATKNIIKADMDKIRIADHDHYLHLTPSGAPSFVGALFAPNVEKDQVLISSPKTVLFMAISSYLAEMTGERKYADTAILGAKCIKNWMLDSTTRLIKDCLIDAQTAQERSGSELSCHLTGIAIEGFTVLASVTGDDIWRKLAIVIARAAMFYQPWHSPEGILTLGQDRATSENTNNKTLKGLLNRGLMVTYERNRSNELFCNMVRSYINVQFNALYELSRIRNAYGMDWRGPYAGPHAHAQVAALDTIVAALGVCDI